MGAMSPVCGSVTVPRTPLSVVGGTKRRTRVRRSAHEKLATVMAVEMSTLTAVSEATGIAKSTLHQWVHDPRYEQVRTRTREDMAEEVKVAAHVVLARLVEAIPTMEGRDLVFAFEKLAEKLQLMTGHATDRVETRDITDTLPPDALDALSDEIDEWLRTRKVEA